MVEYQQHMSDACGSRIKMRFRFPAIAVLRSSSVIATSYDGSEYPQTIQIAALASSSSALLQTGCNHAGISFSETGGIIAASPPRSEEHTSELQSVAYLVRRLLLEKKKNNRSR